MARQLDPDTGPAVRSEADSRNRVLRHRHAHPHRNRNRNGTTAETTDTMAVTLRPQVQSPSLSVRAVTGSENTAIPLTINASPARTETVTISISSVPTGAALSAGSPIPNLSGAWRLSLAELVGLTITPASGYTGTFTLGVVAAATLPGQPAAYTSAVLLVTVAAAI